MGDEPNILGSIPQGEYEQSFEKAFYAEAEGDLVNKINKYLINYYGEDNISEIDGDVYYYLPCTRAVQGWNGEVAVKNQGWEVIID
ncbi:MAG: hypothetical protein ACE5HI_16455, partial [bacterium]